MTSTRTHTIRLLGVAALVTVGLNAAAYGATGGTLLLGLSIVSGNLGIVIGNSRCGIAFTCGTRC